MSGITYLFDDVYEERAAILECDAGMTRERAEREARKECGVLCARCGQRGALGDAGEKCSLCHGPVMLGITL